MTKSLGEHIETFGNTISESISNSRTDELALLKMGWIDDKTKVRMLKYDLYEATRLGKDTAHIREAITSLEDCIDRDLRRKRNQLNNHSVLHDWVTSSIKAGFILLAIWSASKLYPQTCNSNNKSSFCYQSNEVVRYFYDPKI